MRTKHDKNTGARLVTRFCDHDVVVVAIPNTQDVGGHTVASTGVQELLHSLLKLQRQRARQFVM